LLHSKRLQVLIVGATMALTVQNTFIHGVENDSNFNVAEECDGPQPCLRRAHTELAPTSATTDERPCKRERHCTSDDAPPPSAAVAQQEEDISQPAVCRIETRDDEGRYEWQPRCKQPQCHSNNAHPPSAAATQQEEDVPLPALCRFETREDEGRYEWQPRCKQPHCTYNDAPPPSAAAAQQEEDVSLPALCRFEERDGRDGTEETGGSSPSRESGDPWKSAMANIRITARYLSGVALATVAVPTHITIAELKTEIAETAKLEAGVCLQQLIFNGLCLKSTASLEDSGLTDGDNVVTVCGRAIDVDASLRIVVSGLMKGNVALEDDLRCFFHDADCKVADVRLVLDTKKEGKNRGFSFVDLEDHESLDLALKLHNTEAGGLAEKDGKLRIVKARA